MTGKDRDRRLMKFLVMEKINCDKLIWTDSAFILLIDCLLALTFIHIISYHVDQFDYAIWRFVLDNQPRFFFREHDGVQPIYQLMPLSPAFLCEQRSSHAQPAYTNKDVVAHFTPRTSFLHCISLIAYIVKSP